MNMGLKQSSPVVSHANGKSQTPSILTKDGTLSAGFSDVSGNYKYNGDTYGCSTKATKAIEPIRMLIHHNLLEAVS